MSFSMRFKAVIAAIVLWLGVPSNAQAYLDPGTGSAVIQMVVASVMGALFVVKLYWRKLVTFFSGETVEDDSSPAVQTAASDESDRQ
jgi:hypothetical protein